MKIRVSNTAPFWRVLVLLVWVTIVACCIVYTSNEVFHTKDLVSIHGTYFVAQYITFILITTVFAFFTTVFLAKGLLTWLDK